MRFRVLSACFICLFIVACDWQEQTDAINKNTEVIRETTEVKTAPEQTTDKPTQQKTKPALNLSIENIPLDHQEGDDDILNIDKEPADTNSELFETLNRDKAESDINVSGKLLTDEEKIDNEEYLDSIEGLQINIEGSFQ